MKSVIRSAGIIFIISIVLGLIVPCQANDINGINIVGTVTPTSGKENTNFTYSATITFPKGNLEINSALSVTLTISDNRVNKSESQSGKFYGNGLSPGELIRGSSDPYTFSFNPGREGLKNIDDLSYEFVLTTGSGKELARNKYPGPKIVIPPEFQSIQYSKTPVYYFQDFPITLTFNDKPSVIPSLLLSFRGPLNSSDEMSWTEELSPTSVGIIHTFSKPIDFTRFRTGGNFSFNFTYKDFRENEGYAPITGGPYYFTIKPYSPKIVEPISLAKQIEYNNFTLRVLVEDEGKVLMGDPVGSSASLIIDHPIIGEKVFNNSVPTLQGKYLVFEWDKTSVLFEKSDVLQSKINPLQAHLQYWNENQNYGANSSNYSFTLVNVTPLMTENHDSVLHIAGSKTALQKVRAFVTYAKGMGDLKIVATGPGGRYENILKGSSSGTNKYEYDWSMEFNKSQAGNYNLSFTYIHDSLEGGFYEFDQKPEYSFMVVPIFIEFKNGGVSPSRGRWNSSYSYTVEVNSSVEADAILQIYNPCSSEWTDAGDPQKIKPGASNITWTIQPFAYDCDELNSGKYRFRANYLGKDFPTTRVYEGPQIINDEVQLLNLEYSSPVYVPIGSQSEQVVRAMVRSSLGSGKARLGISGPEMNFNETKSGTALGDDSYKYEWTIPFNDSHVDHNYNLSVGYLHPDLVAERPLGERSVQVEPVQISFGKAEVSPEKGRWNDTYIYYVPLNSSVETHVKLEVFNPCSHEWVQRNSGKAAAGQNTFNLTAKPFVNKCADAEGKSASYRFIAGYEGETFKSDVYSGPIISGGTPALVSIDYTPVLYIASNQTAYQVIKAVVESPLGPASLALSINGPNMGIDEDENSGASLGGMRYMYSWSVPFGSDNIGNHTISLRYVHRDLPGGGISFPEQHMSVVEETENNGQPQLLRMDFSPILTIEGNETVMQNITEEIFSPAGKGELELTIKGLDKKVSKSLQDEEKTNGVYVYRWSVPFDASNVGKNYIIASTYRLGGMSYAFDDRTMSVVRKDGTEAQIWEPTLNLEYDRTVYVPDEGKANQVIRATINYINGMGTLSLNLTGPDVTPFQESQNGTDLGGGKYLYKWARSFNNSNQGNEYKISLTYLHPTLVGEEYRFADRYMQVKAAESGTGGIKFSRQQVTPLNGSAFTGFNYRVSPQSDLQKFDVELLTQEPDSTIWTSQGTVPYNGFVDVLTWPNIHIGGTEFGKAKYRFRSGTSTSDTFEGPTIEPASFINSTVIPAHGPLYITTPLTSEISRVYMYTIKANISESLGSDLKEIKLEIYDPSSGSWLSGGSQTYEPTRTQYVFKVNFAELPFQDPFLGETKYRFLANNRELGEFKGPVIDVNLKNEGMIKMGSNRTYDVEVRSSLPTVNIALSFTKDATKWEKGATRPYQSSTQEWKKLIWEKFQSYYEMEFEVVYV